MTDALSTRTGSLVLVFGASGYIGTNLVPFLRRCNLSVRATARNIEVLEGRCWEGVELSAADALDPDSLDVALAGIDVAYYLVHSMAAGKDFAALDRQAAANFAAAAARARVRRIVYLGALSPEKPESMHMQSRQETGDCLRTGPVPVTEIRTGIVIGPGSAAFEVIRDLVYNLPLMITPRWVKSKSPPIALDDLLEYLTRVAYLEAAAGKIYDVGGPEVMTYIDIMRRFGTMVGKKPTIIPVPVLSPRFSSYWLHLITTVPVNIARALIEGLKEDLLADDAPIRTLIPIERKGFEAAVTAALAAEQAHQIPARWVEGSMLCRNYRPDFAFYAKKVSADAPSKASTAALWQQITAFGNDKDYYYLNSLWLIRGALDWLLGGPSFRRGRRHPSAIQVGDTIDAWRVIALQPERRLTLLLEMKLPGAGVLEFEIKPEEQQQRVSVTAYLHPAGIWGLLHWYPVTPFYRIIFKGLARAIARRAEQTQNRLTNTTSAPTDY